ncbi:MAG: GNAT family N-acetyltransferase [Firmicutes bacterium]|jgi:predicted GNAT family N-acyltransferase|nr:GNAT family N-acetyltransferase [Bacillota bacterium]NLO65307.1 GNAT family N-acetyltransferase [Bacillota bacterium]
METYRKLTSEEFEAALALRIKVFVDEQNVPLEEEHDKFDEQAVHFGIFHGETLVGTGRLLTQGKEAKVGRVAILKGFRGEGLGSKLLELMLAEAKEKGCTECIVDAQLQAIPFYSRLGFVAEGDEFLDGGIPHRRMRLRL